MENGISRDSARWWEVWCREGGLDRNVDVGMVHGWFNTRWINGWMFDKMVGFQV